MVQENIYKTREYGQHQGIARLLNAHIHGTRDLILLDDERENTGEERSGNPYSTQSIDGILCDKS